MKESHDKLENFRLSWLLLLRMYASLQKGLRPESITTLVYLIELEIAQL